MNAEHSPHENVRVGLLGLGLTGSAMAGRLLGQGIAVTTWDRNPEHLRDLESRGAQTANEPVDVVTGASAVITMLPTADVIREMVEPLLDVVLERLTVAQQDLADQDLAAI